MNSLSRCLLFDFSYLNLKALVFKYLSEIVGVGEGVKAFGIMFGEHFYCCSEFLVKAGNETIGTPGYWIWELDLVSVQRQSLD